MSPEGWVWFGISWIVGPAVGWIACLLLNGKFGDGVRQAAYFARVASRDPKSKDVPSEKVMEAFADFLDRHSERF